MPASYLLFVATVVSLIMVPGPDMLYVVGRSMTRGRVAAFWAATGIAAGYLVFTGLVALGVGLVFQLEESVFRVVQALGLAYLSWLAYRLFTSDGSLVETADVPGISRGEDFAFGVLTSALNPKGILFYFAILPQFVSPAQGPLWSQALLLGATTSGLCLVLYFAAGLFADAGSRRWVGSPRRRRLVARGAGAVLLVAIVLVATTRFPAA
ncbi:LysE family translocator [Salinarimonas rosea]|uniref:LysE family translocator n=1 Tax=Salinarimonas rosea TaxID=552063 RepID=UPI0003FD4F84|nr:LysE family translocator [Salinarimonas rosea]